MTKILGNIQRAPLANNLANHKVVTSTALELIEIQKIHETNVFQTKKNYIYV